MAGHRTARDAGDVGADDCCGAIGGGVWLREEVKQNVLEKRPKNRNETGSNLSLGTRLMRVKCLSRRRYCDTTLDCCQEGSRLTIYFRIYHKMIRLLPNRGLGGSQGLKCTMKKKIRTTSTLALKFTSK